MSYVNASQMGGGGPYKNGTHAPVAQSYDSQALPGGMPMPKNRFQQNIKPSQQYRSQNQQHLQYQYQRQPLLPLQQQQQPQPHPQQYQQQYQPQSLQYPPQPHQYQPQHQHQPHSQLHSQPRPQQPIPQQRPQQTFNQSQPYRQDVNRYQPHHPAPSSQPQIQSQPYNSYPDPQQQLYPLSPQFNQYALQEPPNSANTTESFHFEQIRSPVSQTFSFEEKPALPPKIPVIPASPSVETLNNPQAVTPYADPFPENSGSDSNNDSVDDLLEHYMKGTTLKDSSKESSGSFRSTYRKEKMRPSSMVKELEFESPPPYEELDHSVDTAQFSKDEKRPGLRDQFVNPAEGSSSQRGAPSRSLSSENKSISSKATSSNSLPYPIDDPITEIQQDVESKVRKRRYTDELLEELKEQNELRRASSDMQKNPSVPVTSEKQDATLNFLQKRSDAVQDYKKFTLEPQLEWAKVLLDAIEKKAIITSMSITGQLIKPIKTEADLKRNKVAFLNASIKVLKKLSDKYDNAESQALLGDICSGSKFPDISDKDTQKGFEYYLRATKGKHANATYKTGCCIEHGMGTKKDLAKCFYFYEKSALLGDSDGMCKLGIIYIKGLFGQQKSVQKSVYWLNKSILTNEASLLPLYILAKIHETDVSTLGLQPHSVDADAKIVRELQRMGIYRNTKTLSQLYLKAAKLGHTKSQSHLGYCFEYGFMGCTVNPKTSIYWYSKAAQKGDLNAEMGLSGWYLTGSEGLLQQSDVELYLWARKASEKGLAKAEYALGYFNEVGVGTPKNLGEAKRWYRTAASQGYAKALKKLESFK